MLISEYYRRPIRKMQFRKKKTGLMFYVLKLTKSYASTQQWTEQGNFF